MTLTSGKIPTLEEFRTLLRKHDLKVTVQQIGSGSRGPHGLFERQDDYTSVCWSSGTHRQTRLWRKSAARAP